MKPFSLSTPWAILLIVLLASYAAIPLAQPYLFASDDGQHHLYRLWEEDQLIRQGVFFSRWAPDFFYGYGYPISNYVSPLPYYPGVVFHLLGLSYIDSLKLLFWLCLPLSGLTMYLYARQHLSRTGSLLASVLYMYAPYHLVDLYLRGALRELLAFIWFPFILWALRGLLVTGRLVYLPILSSGYAALIVSHSLSAYLFTPALLLYAAFLWRERGPKPRTAAASLAGAMALGLGLSAFYLVPALAELHLVHMERSFSRLEEHLFPLLTLVSTSLVHSYGTAPFAPPLEGFRLGLVQFVLFLGGLGVLRWRWRRSRPSLRSDALWGLLLFLGGLFLMQPAALWFWENAPLAQRIQFPWRLLALLALPTAFLGGLFVDVLPLRARSIVTGVLVGVVVATSLLGLRVVRSTLAEDQVSTLGNWAHEMGYDIIGTSAGGEFLPIWVQRDPAPLVPKAVSGMASEAKYSSDPPHTLVELLERGGLSFRYRVRAQEPARLTLNHLYYPGWSAWAGDQPISLEPSTPEGLVSLSLPAGEHILELRFGETPLRLAMDVLSVLSAMVLLGLLGRHLSLRPLNWREAALRLWGWRPQRALWALGTAGLLGGLWLVGWRLYPWPFGEKIPQEGFFAQQVGQRLWVQGLALEGVEQGPAPFLRRQGEQPLKVTLQLLPRAHASFSEQEYLYLCLADWTMSHRCVTRPLAALLRPESTGRGAVVTLELPVPVGLPWGLYRLETGVYDAATDQKLLVTRQVVVPLVVSEPHRLTPPLLLARDPPAQGAVSLRDLGEGIAFEDGTVLRGHHFPAESGLERRLRGLPEPPGGDPRKGRAGHLLPLDLLWQLSPSPLMAYASSVRLVDAQSDTYAFASDLPLAPRQSPRFPYQPQDLLRQRIGLYVPYEVPPGEYTLQVALFSAGSPLATLSSGHWVSLGQVSVHPAAQVPGRPPKQLVATRSLPLRDDLGIFDYRLLREALRPGDTADIDLYWQAKAPPAQDLRARFELSDERGGSLGVLTVPVGGPGYPTSRWRTGEVIRGQYRLPVAQDASQGPATLWVSLLVAEGEAAIARARLGTLQIQERPRRFQAPSVAHPASTGVPGVARLLGFNLAGGPSASPPVLRLAPGTTAPLTLVWEAAGPTPASYQVSLQLLDRAGRLVAQHDGVPAGGQAPSTTWVAGEMVEDPHPLVLPRGLAAGSYRLIVVLYQEATGQRLLFADGKDYAELGEVVIGG